MRRVSHVEHDSRQPPCRGSKCAQKACAYRVDVAEHIGFENNTDEQWVKVEPGGILNAS